FDRWYAIYRRRPKEELYQTSRGWRSPEQLEHLRRDDLAALDAALAKAQQATLTAEQRQRLAHLTTYYMLMRLNAEQYLVSRELGDRRWIGARESDAMLKLAEDSLPLTVEFDRLWREQIAADKSGWLLDARHQKNPQEYWDDFLGQLRTMISSGHETAIDTALDTLTERMLKQESKDKVIAHWRELMKQRARLEPHIGPQINKLMGVEPPNVVVNGGFEKGAPGDPPTLPGWEFYENYGMVKGVRACYVWERSGHNGGHAIGLGAGQFAEMKAIISLEQGRRYELSFWYKTVNRETPANLSLFSYDGPLASASEISRDKISKFARIDLEPTDGQWKKITRSLTPPRGGTFVIQLAAYYQADGTWTWFDEIEIRKIW
ncbi:MAG: hypothetical protein FJ388_22180, partial [Verrucomicrobia bacterium]|nr:hypothetical protein [Verrucomicrobiota bacterium]